MTGQFPPEWVEVVAQAVGREYGIGLTTDADDRLCDRTECKGSVMTEIDFTSYRSQRTAAAEQIEQLDTWAQARLQEYLDSPQYAEFYVDRSLPNALRRKIIAICTLPGNARRCGRNVSWEVADVDERGISFTHDCRDHGHDLPCTESFLLPAEYLADPEEFWGQKQAAVQKVRQDIEQLRRERAAQARADRRRQYEKLRAEFEGEGQA